MGAQATTPVPVVILTGDLGAGKTTLINRLLARAGGRRIAIVENEAGEIGIDTELIDGASEIVDLPEGCACCTVRGALSGALDDLADRAEQFDALIVELSGLADPVPIIQAFQQPGPRATFRIAALIGLVAATGATNAGLWRRQLRFADLIVVSKLTSGESPTEALMESIRQITQSAPIITEPPAAIDALLNLTQTPTPPQAVDHDHGTEQPPETVAIEIEGDMDPQALDDCLQQFALAAGESLLRVKGIAAVGGSRKRHVIQYAHGVYETYADRPWVGPRRTRLVLIGHDLQADALREGLGRSQTAPRRRPNDAMSRTP